MLIGNKTDLEHRRVVSFQEAGRVGFSQGVALAVPCVRARCPFLYILYFFL